MRREAMRWERGRSGHYTTRVGARATTIAHRVGDVLEYLHAHVAQGIEHLPPEQGVAGSNPAVGIRMATESRHTAASGWIYDYSKP